MTTNTKLTLGTALMPFLTVAMLLWSASCAHAQTPPVPEWSWRSLLVWQVPVQPTSLTLEFECQPDYDVMGCHGWLRSVTVKVETSNDLLHWQALTNWTVNSRFNSLVVSNLTASQRFYRVGFL